MDGKHRGILAIWHDIVPEHRDDVLAWYDAEHHVERLDVPGFLSVRRYSAVQGSPELFIRYETESVDVLSSEPYLARLNHPTPWTVQSQPRFLNNSRTVCVRTDRIGRAEGGFVVTARIEGREAEATSPEWNWAATADALMARRGIVGAELWKADRARSTIATAEKKLRGGEDRYVDAVVVVHATDQAAAGEALGHLNGRIPHSASRPVTAGIYALAFSASNSTS
jgi:hypothetical protein